MYASECNETIHGFPDSIWVSIDGMACVFALPFPAESRHSECLTRDHYCAPCAFAIALVWLYASEYNDTIHGFPDSIWVSIDGMACVFTLPFPAESRHSECSTRDHYCALCAFAIALVWLYASECNETVHGFPDSIWVSIDGMACVLALPFPAESRHCECSTLRIVCICDSIFLHVCFGM